MLLIKDSITKLDDAILNIISIRLKNTVLDTVMPVITWSNNYGQVYLLFVLVSIYNDRFNKWGKAVILSLLLEVTICELLIKPLFKRSRPSATAFNKIDLLIKKPLSYSFPSGHTASSFAAAGVLWNMDSDFKYLVLTIALLVSFSRIYLLVHYPSDIFAGMILGLAVGKLAYEFYYGRQVLTGFIIIFCLVVFRILKIIYSQEVRRYENTFNN